MSPLACSPAVTARRGFTLLELLLAIMLTAVAVAIAGSALRTATTAGERVDAHRATLEHDARLRSTLTDMLRHPPSAESVDEPLIRLSASASGDAQLVFLSKGVRAPFGTGATWRVTLSVDDTGLVLDAQPIGAATDGTVLHTVQPGVHQLSIRVLERVDGLSSTAGGARRDAQWRSDWPLDRTRPAMIALEFGDATLTPPLIVALDPLATVVSMAVRR